VSRLCGGSAHELEPADETENLSNDANADDRNADDEPLTDNDGASPTGAATRHVSELADLLVTAAKGQIDKSDALNWLLFTHPGRRLAHRHAALHKSAAPQQRNKQMRSHPELMSDVVKKYGIVRFCKSVEQGDVRVSEHELTKLIDEQAKRENTSFVKLFEAQDERGIVLRKAIAAARDQQWLEKTTTMSKAAEGMPGRATIQPRVVGGAAAQAVDNPKSALAELQALVDEQRAQNPALSESMAWQRVYEHPSNADLARREREENRPVASWG
jgi:hypothetical protein